MGSALFALALSACSTRVSLGGNDVRIAPSDAALDAPADIPLDSPVDAPSVDSQPDAQPDATTGVPRVVLARVSGMALGAQHSCAIGEDFVACWGRNDRGQLGDGTTADRTYPGRVSTLGTMQELALGVSHSCALAPDGAALCWGSNEYGQLGDGTTTDHRLPTRVSHAGEPLAHVFAGASHTCAIDTAGAAYCWGNNAAGQLGDGTTVTTRATPVRVEGLSMVTHVSLGASYTCARTADGGVYCWGEGYARTPTRVAGLGPALSVASGRCHSCAVLSADRSVWCWGCNDRGQLGDGTVGPARATPGMVMSPDTSSSVEILRIGDAHVCTKGASTVRCWGAGDLGQLGLGTLTDQSSPQTVGSFVRVGITGLWTGARHSCSLTSSGLACWGDNSSGQLGDGSTTMRTIPTPID